MPNILTPEHRQHLEAEGFTPAHIDQLMAWGVCSLDAPTAVKNGFYISLGQGKKDFSSGLYFPFTDGEVSPSAAFGQIRCDRPLTRLGKKSAKYLTQVGKKSQAWLPEGCTAITEGYKDAARATVEGVPVGAVAGVSHYRKALPQSAGYTLIFDSDGWGNAQVFSNLFQGGLWLKGKINLLPAIPDEPKGGMCEWFKAGVTAADVEALIANAYSPIGLLLEWPNHWADLKPEPLLRCIRVAIGLAAAHLREDERQLLINAIAEHCPLGKRQLQDMLKWASQRQAKKAPAKPKEGTKDAPFKELASHESALAKQFKKVRSVWGRHLRFNELTGEVELAGVELDLDEARMRLALEHDVELPACNVEPIVVTLAKANSYHPVVSYLDRVAEKYGDDTSILTGIADRYFGAKDPIYQTMVTRTLIAAVARAYEPGCQMRTALILQGKQLDGKSKWFKTLAGDEFFDDSLGDSKDADERLKLQQSWFIEWAELETVFRRKDVEATKAFLSCSVDLVRAPYAKKAKRMKRRSIIVGSSNRDDFLTDTTGNTRFWVVPVQHRVIPIELLREERDRIWAAAVALYRAGQQWHLTDLELEAASAIASQFEATDTWAEAIEGYVEGQRDYTNPQQEEWPTSPLETITVQELLSKIIKLPLAQQDRRAEMRVAAIMQQLGWEKKRVRIDGSRAYVWQRPLPEVPAPEPVAESLPAPPLVTTPDHPEWHPFEQGLVSAQSLSELRALKERTPEAIRKPCMNRWTEDGRYRWLEEKVQTLTQQETQHAN